MGWVVSVFSSLKAEVEWLITSLAVAPTTDDSATSQDGIPAETAAAHHNDSVPDAHGTVLLLADQQLDVSPVGSGTPTQYATVDDAPASAVQNVAFSLPNSDNLVIPADFISGAPAQTQSDPLTPLSLTDGFSASDVTTSDSSSHAIQDLSFSSAPVELHSESHLALPNSGVGDFALASLAPDGTGFSQGGSGTSGNNPGGGYSGVEIISADEGTPFKIALKLDTSLYNLSSTNPSEYTQITNDLQTLANFFASHFTNNPNDPTHPEHSFIVDVGWGENGGSAIPAGALGESSYNLYAVPSSSTQSSYAVLQQQFANIAVANENADGSQVVNIPAQEPFSSSNPEFMVTAAEKHALNIPITSGTQGGGVGFSSAANTFFFDPNSPQPNQYDFMGIAAHEISEVLGRITVNGAKSGNYKEFTSFDLFHFADSNGAPISSGTTAGYFSIDNGSTNLTEFNSSSSGDHGDWATTTAADAFDTSPPAGVDLPFSYADYLAMEAAGYSGSFHYDTSLSQTTTDWNNALGPF